MMIRTKTEQPLSEEESEALEWFKALLDRPDMRITATMQPGEAVFINNYEVLHGREAFEDAGGPEGRLLLRLWLEGAPPRPRPPEQTVTINRSGHQGIDPRDGLPTLG
jgi:alpha-ketoglutarate-dependent taurine dioxygenase